LSEAAEIYGKIKNISDLSEIHTDYDFAFEKFRIGKRTFEDAIEI